MWYCGPTLRLPQSLPTNCRSLSRVDWRCLNGHAGSNLSRNCRARQPESCSVTSFVKKPCDVMVEQLSSYDPHVTGCEFTRTIPARESPALAAAAFLGCVSSLSSSVILSGRAMERL